MITPTQSGSSSNKKVSWFRTLEGNNYAFIFVLVSSLFLLWGVCNGMIDVLNKHFQDSLHITKAESAFVQFANYMGYFFMAIPSGLLAIRFGYKGAIIIGLAFVAAGAFWFIPATHIGTYWAFLLGLFILAAGLTCLETVCNPYATVLGPPESGAARINLAQSANGIGWMIGPVLGGYFVLSSTGEAITTNTDLYKPYLIVAMVVALIAVTFILSKVPDLHNMEETKAATGAVGAPKPLIRRSHFVLAVAAQFFYVAAQTGIFSFFINYVVSETPVLGQGLANRLQSGANILHTVIGLPPAQMTYSASMFTAGDITDLSGLVAKLQNDPDTRTHALSTYIWSGATNTQAALAAAPVDTTNETTALVKDLNNALQDKGLYGTAHLVGTSPPEDTSDQQLIRYNRGLMESAYPASELARGAYLQEPLFHVTDRGASILLSFGGFALFLLGRITGSFALRVFKSHSILALYSIVNIAMMLLIMFPLGWWSVAGLFLSFFFMSIMYPTIFALGIHGLGEQTKIASAFIVQAIVGGAIMPLFMGWLADNWGMRIGFFMPLLCFAFIAFYGLAWQKLENKDRAA